MTGSLDNSVPLYKAVLQATFNRKRAPKFRPSMLSSLGSRHKLIGGPWAKVQLTNTFCLVNTVFLILFKWNCLYTRYVFCSLTQFSLFPMVLHANILYYPLVLALRHLILLFLLELVSLTDLLWMALGDTSSKCPSHIPSYTFYLCTSFSSRLYQFYTWLLFLNIPQQSWRLIFLITHGKRPSPLHTH